MIPSKDRGFWQGAKCDLVNDDGVFITSKCVIACDHGKQLLMISLVKSCEIEHFILFK
jgi:hypothetical protein